MSCDGQQQINYVNGIQENRGPINFALMEDTGALSVGVRLNHVCWFLGAISEVHLTGICHRPRRVLSAIGMN